MEEKNITEPNKCVQIIEPEFDKISGLVESYMWEAFLLGAWYGQADMEQYMDNNFIDNVRECVSARKRCLPVFEKSEGRTVRYNLRSDKWRKAIFAKKDEFKDLIPKLCNEIRSAFNKIEVNQE